MGYTVDTSTRLSLNLLLHLHKIGFVLYIYIRLTLDLRLLCMRQAKGVVTHSGRDEPELRLELGALHLHGLVLVQHAERAGRKAA